MRKRPATVSPGANGREVGASGAPGAKACVAPS